MDARRASRARGTQPARTALRDHQAATLTQCGYCVDVGSAISRRWGLADEEILALPGYQTSPLFSDLDKLVLDYAVGPAGFSHGMVCATPAVHP
jgi:alkylhydroperoxidase family enzyme